MKCFKAYDVRGVVPEELDEGLAWRIGLAYAAELAPDTVAVGRDARLSGPALAEALIDGLRAGGVRVLDLGMCGAEEMYFATFSQNLDGGIVVTGSHNPREYNGMKFVRQGARPVSGDSGLWAIRERVLAGAAPGSRVRGGLERRDFRDQYIEHLLGYVDTASLAPLRILANPGNGCAGPVVRLLGQRLPFDLRLIQEQPDGNFPNGVPNPLLPERRGATAAAVASCGADLGLAWDGDFDRCFFFDASGALVEGYYLVGLLAQVFLQSHPGERILHDPRLVWNTRDAVLRAGGTPVQCKTGHAFIKERMRRENAVYGGEMSAHHYFRDFAFCDSGMIPWLVVAHLMSSSGRPLAQLVGDCLAAYPCSGEINYAVARPHEAMQAVRDHFAPQKPQVDETDGLGLEFADWRMNLRPSNTEPLLRLNVESRGSMPLVRARVAEVGEIIDALRPEAG